MAHTADDRVGPVQQHQAPTELLRLAPAALSQPLSDWTSDGRETPSPVGSGQIIGAAACTRTTDLASPRAGHRGGWRSMRTRLLLTCSVPSLSFVAHIPRLYKSLCNDYSCFLWFYKLNTYESSSHHMHVCFCRWLQFHICHTVTTGNVQNLKDKEK